jgi:hypothetical protein
VSYINGISTPTVTYSSVTGKVTFTNTLQTTQLVFPANSPAAAKLGFVAGNTYNSTGTFTTTLTSVKQVVVNASNVFDFHTSIPRKNYRIKSDKFAATTLTARIPVTVPFQATQIYQDLVGANAMYEAYRDHLDTIEISLRDEFDNILNPNQEWLFTLAIETWVDDTDTHTSYLADVSESLKDLNLQGKMKMVKKQMDEDAQKNSSQNTKQDG